MACAHYVQSTGPGFLPLRFSHSTVFFLTMPNKRESILLVGVITGLVVVLASFIPAAGDFIGCLAYIGAGMLVVWHYVDKHSVTLTGGQGIGLGVLTCLAAYVTAFVLDAGLRALAIKPSWQEEMRQGMEQGGADMSQLGGFGEFMTSPGFLGVMILVGLVFAVIAGVIGGVIGSKLFKRGEEEGAVQDSSDLI